MKKVIFILLIIASYYGCKKGDPIIDLGEKKGESLIDPCSKLVNGVYQYPVVSPDSGTTGITYKEYWNIPEDVLPCLKADGLLETCLNYHDLGSHMILGGLNGVQTSYDFVKSICRGFLELEDRPDALDALIAKYKSIDTVHYDTLLTLNNLFKYGGYDFFTYNLEAILGQEVFLQNATTEQKIALLSELLVKQDFKEHRDSWYFFEGPAFVMARLMYLDNYQPFMDEYAINSRIKRTVTWGSPTYDEARLIIVSFAENYLSLLKTK